MKSKFTKTERYKIYKTILTYTNVEKKEHQCAFICGNLREAISQIYDCDYPSLDQDKLLEMFPEILHQKPQTTYGSITWFSCENYNARLKIIKKAIIDTTPKKK